MESFIRMVRLYWKEKYPLPLNYEGFLPWDIHSGGVFWHFVPSESLVDFCLLFKLLLVFCLIIILKDDTPKLSQLNNTTDFSSKNRCRVRKWTNLCYAKSYDFLSWATNDFYLILPPWQFRFPDLACGYPRSPSRCFSHECQWRTARYMVTLRP